MTVRWTVRTGGKACIAMHEIRVPLPKQRRHLLRCLFCFGIRIMIRAQTFEQRLFSQSEKDCAYRVRGILPCEEMSLPLCKSGTIFAKHTPSGKLCISYTPLAGYMHKCVILPSAVICASRKRTRLRRDLLRKPCNFHKVVIK